jgi:hypothetical protein
MTDLVQGEAVILLGPDAGSTTDYSCWISEFVINETRTTFAKAPSFSSPAIEDKAAADQAAVTMTSGEARPARYPHPIPSAPGSWSSLRSGPVRRWGRAVSPRYSRRLACRGSWRPDADVDEHRGVPA